MRIVPVVTFAAALFVAAATTVSAQSTQPQTNTNTKVYAYKKTAPKQANEPAAIAMPATTSQAKPFEHLRESVPYGSANWWDMHTRSNSAGD
jgi:hypothetical protein